MVSACGSSDDSTSSATSAADTAAAPAASTDAAASTAAGAPALKTGLKIAVIPKAINNPYFDAAFVGAQKACTELGASCEQVGPTEATGAAQAEFINASIQKGVDAIVISAADADSVTPLLQQAKSAGITVVTYDADVNDTSARARDDQADHARPDRHVAADKWVSDAIGPDGGEIAILSAAATAENQNAWIELMKADLAANYPQLKLVDTVYGDDDAAKSADKAAALMQAHPNLKGIIAPTTVGVARRREVHLRLGVQGQGPGHRTRPAERDEARTSRTAPSRPSASGIRACSATSASTPPSTPPAAPT